MCLWDPAASSAKSYIHSKQGSLCEKMARREANFLKITALFGRFNAFWRSKIANNSLVYNFFLKLISEYNRALLLNFVYEDSWQHLLRASGSKTQKTQIINKLKMVPKNSFLSFWASCSLVIKQTVSDILCENIFSFLLIALNCLNLALDCIIFHFKTPFLT